MYTLLPTRASLNPMSGLTEETGGLLLRVGGAVGGYLLAPLVFNGKVPGFVGAIVGYLLASGVARIGSNA